MLRKKQKLYNTQKDTEKILDDQTSFHIKEAYKALRTNMMFSLSGKETKKVVVTSSYPGEGKSTTCINLALTFAQMGKKVLVMDADLRKSTVHHKLNIPNNQGLSHLISGLATLEEVVVKDVTPNLDVMTSGHIPPNPVELLVSSEMKQVLKDLEAHYEYIFIDTPPVNVVTDAAVLSDKVSGTILVVRQDITHHKDIQQALEKLAFAQAKVLGVVLHDVKETKSKYTRYGKYSKYSKYEAYESIPTSS